VKGAAARGREFEAEVADFLRSAGFDVTPNAKTAKPRQTDLFAKDDNLDLLVETKNQKRNVGVNDIDSLRSRLGRTTSDIVGAIFTTSGLTKGAIEEIEKDRTRLTGFLSLILEVHLSPIYSKLAHSLLVYRHNFKNGEVSTGTPGNWITSSE